MNWYKKTSNGPTTIEEWSRLEQDHDLKSYYDNAPVRVPPPGQYDLLQQLESRNKGEIPHGA